MEESASATSRTRSARETLVRAEQQSLADVDQPEPVSPGGRRTDDLIRQLRRSVDA